MLSLNAAYKFYCEIFLLTSSVIHWSKIIYQEPISKELITEKVFPLKFLCIKKMIRIHSHMVKIILQSPIRPYRCTIVLEETGMNLKEFNQCDINIFVITRNLRLKCFCVERQAPRHQ